MSTFFCFLLASFEAGGHRPQPQVLRSSESREAFRLGVKTGGVALGLQTRQAVLYVFVFILLIRSFSFLPQEHIRSPRREIGYGCGVSRGKEGVAPASALAEHGGDEMCLRFAGIKTDKNNLRLVKPCRVCRWASRRAKSVRFCSPLIPAATAVSKRPLHRPQGKNH